MQDELGIAPNRINDAVEHLFNLGYINWLQTIDTSPYGFNRVWLETAGRVEYQKTQAHAVPLETAQSRDDIRYDVFLSHSSLDDRLATDVKQLLEANGIRTFATPGSILTGSWESQIESALRSSSTIWVLLTQNTLRESVWAHQEFGYFYGYNHGKERDIEGHACRFLYERGTQLRGLYAWIQGTPIESIGDPVVVSETIAVGLGKEFRVPSDWIHQTYPQQGVGLIEHPRMGRVGFNQSRGVGGPGSVEIQIRISEIDETVYYVAALTIHPDIELQKVTMADVVDPSDSDGVKFQLRYRDKPVETLPTELCDARGRRFSLLPGPRAPEGMTPLLITFETEDRRALAAIFYYTVGRHSKGFPEVKLQARLPMDWREGWMPST